MASISFTRGGDYSASNKVTLFIDGFASVYVGRYDSYSFSRDGVGYYIEGSTVDGRSYFADQTGPTQIDHGNYSVFFDFRDNITNVYAQGGRYGDLLYTGAGSDVLRGEGGNDTLNGGAGADVMIGGYGNDRYYVDNASDVIFERVGGGTDYVLASVSYGLKGGVEIERLSTININATTAINLTGNEFAQRIDGNQTGNKLSGLGGNDALYGYGGNDALYGGAGKDVLTGGLGNDSFVFDTPLDGSTNVDTITDFHNVSGDNDTIRLENAVFTTLTKTGALDPKAFASIKSGATYATDDRIIYYSDKGTLYYDADGFGGAKPVLFAVLTGHPAITAADFIVI